MMELAVVIYALLLMILVIAMPEKAYSEADIQNGVTTETDTAASQLLLMYDYVMGACL